MIKAKRLQLWNSPVLTLRRNRRLASMNNYWKVKCILNLWWRHESKRIGDTATSFFGLSLSQNWNILIPFLQFKTHELNTKYTYSLQIYVSIQNWVRILFFFPFLFNLNIKSPFVNGQMEMGRFEPWGSGLIPRAKAKARYQLS